MTDGTRYNTTGRNVAVFGLGFGDEGKGAWTDRLTAADHRLAVVVRYNGGAQAAHNVYASGRHHTFRTFGSGTLQGLPTLLDQDVLIDTDMIGIEAARLEHVGVHNPLAGLHIHEHARMVTEWHKAANRARETARGNAAHGSCGMGIGETAQYARDWPTETIHARDLTNPTVLAAKLDHLAAVYGPYLDAHNEPRPDNNTLLDRYAHARAGLARNIVGDGWLHDWVTPHQSTVMFEGAQGVLLDEDNGFHPHTTWSHTGMLVPDLICAREHLEPPLAYGATRTYHTRHGYGPFPTDTPDQWTAPPEPDNTHGQWQGAWRTGPFDRILAGYAVRAAARLDGILISHADRIDTHANVHATSYRTPTGETVTTLPDPPHSEQLDQQEHLTGWLNTITPVYETVPTSEAVNLIGAAYNAPVVAAAYGPDRHDTRQPVHA